MQLQGLGWLALLVSWVGCGHDAGDPGTVPIDPITFDSVFVVNGGDATLSVIDADSDEVAAVIQLQNADYPHHAYLSPDRSSLLVAVPGFDLSEGHDGGGHAGHGAASSVLRLDATTGALLGFTRLEAAGHNAIYAPDGGAVWTAQMTSPGSVLRLDPSTFEPLQTIEVGDDPAEVTFAAGRAFVANSGSDSVSVIDAATGEVVDTVVVGDTPVGAWPGADGLMYVDNEAGQSITAFDPESLEVIQTYDLGFTPAIAAVSPAGELWVADTDGGQLVFLDPSDGTRLGDLATGAGAHAITFSPDGAKAWVSNQASSSVSVVDVASKSVTATLSVGDKPNGMVYRAR